MQTCYPASVDFLSMSDADLATVDLVVMNLAVGKAIPALHDLDIGEFVNLADEWADDLRQRMPHLEREFRATPQDWRNDLDYFRLGLVCWYVDIILGMAYNEDQRSLKPGQGIRYTDPGDLFLNGLMASRRGTCATMSLMHVVLGKRLGFPVSLACWGSHFLCRYDDGHKIINVEATDTGRGGFATPTDEEILTKKKLPRKAQECGSDLRALTPREMLGVFVGHRARHLENTGHFAEADKDYCLARWLFPNNRNLFIGQHQTSVQQAITMFESHEKGHPRELAWWMKQVADHCLYEEALEVGRQVQDQIRKKAQLNENSHRITAQPPISIGPVWTR